MKSPYHALSHSHLSLSLSPASSPPSHVPSPSPTTKTSLSSHSTMSIADDSSVQFKEDLRRGNLKFGLFVNSHSPTVANLVAHMGFDWLLIDMQHGPMNYENLSNMLMAVHEAGAKSMVRVAAFDDRAGIQQALDLGADGILVPYINNADEAKHAVSCCRYPTAGTRSVYFPQRSTNKKGLLGYVGNSNKNVIIALQIETADSIKNMDTIAAVEGVDMLFLGQNDLCMSMGLFEKYTYPDMYFSKELGAATDKMIAAAKRNNKILGIFLFGTDRVQEFVKKGYVFFSIGNDLHHIMTQAQTHMGKLKEVAKAEKKNWLPRKSAFL